MRGGRIDGGAARALRGTLMATLGAALAIGAGCRRPGSDAAAGGSASAVAGTPDTADADEELKRGVSSTAIVARAARGVPAERFPAPTRPVADIVAPRWSAEENRDDAGEAARVFELASVGRGTRVADIGAGDGYYVVRAADVVGSEGRVWAQDIAPDYLQLLQRRLRDTPKRNVVIALGEPHDPRLPPLSVDVALMVHMYHEITQPFGLLHNLAPALRPGARVVVLDMDAPTANHGTPPKLLDCEFRAMGYRLQRRTATGPGEYVAVYTLPGAVTPPDSVAPRLARGGCAAIATEGTGR